MLMAPNTGKRGEKRIEGGDELDARQGVDSSAHLKLEEDNRTDRRLGIPPRNAA